MVESICLGWRIRFTAFCCSIPKAVLRRWRCWSHTHARTGDRQCRRKEFPGPHTIGQAKLIHFREFDCTNVITEACLATHNLATQRATAVAKQGTAVGHACTHTHTHTHTHGRSVFTTTAYTVYVYKFHRWKTNQ